MIYLKFVITLFLIFCITLIKAQEESCTGCSMERRKPMRYGKRGDYPIDWKSIGNSLNNERHQKLILIPVRKSYLDQLRFKNNPNPYYMDSANRLIEINNDM